MSVRLKCCPRTSSALCASSSRVLVDDGVDETVAEHHASVGRQFVRDQNDLMFKPRRPYRSRDRQRRARTSSSAKTRRRRRPAGSGRGGPADEPPAKPRQLACLGSFMLSPNAGVVTGALVDCDQQNSGLLSGVDATQCPLFQIVRGPSMRRQGGMASGGLRQAVALPLRRVPSLVARPGPVPSGQGGVSGRGGSGSHRFRRQ